MSISPTWSGVVTVDDTSTKVNKPPQRGDGNHGKNRREVQRYQGGGIEEKYGNTKVEVKHEKCIGMFSCYINKVIINE